MPNAESQTSQSPFKYEDDPIKYEIRVGFFESSVNEMTAYITTTQTGETPLDRVRWAKARQFKLDYNRLTLPEDRLGLIDVVLEATRRINEELGEEVKPLIPPPKFRLFSPEDWERVAHLYKARGTHG